jgi:hypothetical protein
MQFVHMFTLTCEYYISTKSVCEPSLIINTSPVFREIRYNKCRAPNFGYDLIVYFFIVLLAIDSKRAHSPLQ